MIESARGVLRFLAERCAAETAVVAALATVDERGTARVRHVVLRGLHAGLATLWMSSHIDAAKVLDLRSNPLAELAIWFPVERVQVRLLARWRIIDARTRSATHARARRSAWQAHSPTAQALFTWPAGGRPFQNETSATTPFSRTTPPLSFALLHGTARQLDVLQIDPAHHRRYLHQCRGATWRTRRVTP